MESCDFGARLALIEDDRALRKLIQNYLSHADSRQWKAWIETFAEDADFDLPNSFGLMRGKKEIYDVCVDKMDGTWAETQHMIVNVDLAVEGDDASGTANIFFSGVPMQAGATDTYLMGGRYRWRFARTDAGWRIADAWEEFIWNNGTALQSVFEVAGQ